jgi:hypothetical protein
MPVRIRSKYQVALELQVLTRAEDGVQHLGKLELRFPLPAPVRQLGVRKQHHGQTAS